MRWLVAFLVSSVAWGLVDGKRVSPSSPEEPAPRQALSAIVKLSLGNDGSGTCDATVVSRNPPMLATARHCVEDAAGKPKVLQALTFYDALLEALPKQLPAKVKQIHVNAAEKTTRGRGDYALVELEEGGLPQRAGVAFVPKTCPLLKAGAVLAGGKPDPKRPGTSVWIAGHGGDGALRWATTDVTSAVKGVVQYRSSAPGDPGGPVFAPVPGQTGLALVAIAGAPDPKKIEAADLCDPLTNRFFTSVATRGAQPQIGTSLVPQDDAQSHD